MPNISINCIANVSNKALQKIGVPKTDAEIITESILYANIRGIHTHGIGRLPLYVNKVRLGYMNPDTPLEYIADCCGVALVDAHNGFGQVAAYRAMEMCIKKSSQYGVGVVGVRNSNSFGTAAFFGEMAAKAGMLGIIFANSSPACAPTGGYKPLLGTNPICFAVPGSESNYPVILDMATTVAARGKIRLAAKNNEKIPFGWALDSDGKPTDDPNEALKGTLLPIGDYKGYGISLFVDILAGMITGSLFAGEVKPLSDQSGPSGNGHMFLTVNLACFLSKAEYEDRLNRLVTNIKNCGEPENIYLPGEKSYKAALNNDGWVNLPQVQVNEINKVLADLNIDLRLE